MTNLVFQDILSSGFMFNAAWITILVGDDLALSLLSIHLAQKYLTGEWSWSNLSEMEYHLSPDIW